MDKRCPYLSANAVPLTSFKLSVLCRVSHSELQSARLLALKLQRQRAGTVFRNLLIVNEVLK